MEYSTPPAIVFRQPAAKASRGWVSPFAERDFQVAWNKASASLERLFALPQNWDGDGAEAPSRAILFSVRDLLEQFRASQVPAPNRIVPMSDGGIVLDWQDPPHFVTIEVQQPYLAEQLTEHDGGESEYREWKWAPLRFHSGHAAGSSSEIEELVAGTC